MTSEIAGDGFDTEKEISDNAVDMII